MITGGEREVSTAKGGGGGQFWTWATNAGVGFNELKWEAWKVLPEVGGWGAGRK